MKNNLLFFMDLRKTIRNKIKSILLEGGSYIEDIMNFDPEGDPADEKELERLERESNKKLPTETEMMLALNLSSDFKLPKHPNLEDDSEKSSMLGIYNSEGDPKHSSRIVKNILNNNIRITDKETNENEETPVVGVKKAARKFAEIFKNVERNDAEINIGNTLKKLGYKVLS